MLKSLQVPQITDESILNMGLANWAWNSHSWVEYSSGYYKCEWCGNSHTSVAGINADYPLCKENPAIKKMAEEFKKGTIACIKALNAAMEE